MMNFRPVINVFQKLWSYHDIRQPHLFWFEPRHFSSLTSSNHSEVTAGVLIIGDEILNGQTEDKNTSFFINNLNNINIKINKIVFLPDDVDTIAQEVFSLSHMCNVVLTSGGIGPTHDDVTFEAVAKAFGEVLIKNQELENLFKDYFGPLTNQYPAVQKFSSIPQSAVLNFNDWGHGKYKFPLISTKNVYMFPGVPMLLHNGFEIFKSKFSLRNKPNFKAALFLATDEFSVTPLLNETVKMFEGQVKFGSYPTFTNNYYKVKITLEGLNGKIVNDAKEFLSSLLPKGKVVNIRNNQLESFSNRANELFKENPSFSQATSVIEKAIKTYDLSETCICFNGGKDCTVLLHLVYSLVMKVKPGDWQQIKVIYVRNGETFREVEDFIQSCVKYYNINLIILEGDLKLALSEFLKSHPNIKAAFMGTRKCDPGAEFLKHFYPTDAGWPPIMRVLPILEWTYMEIWSYIRELQLPYCILYDRGYTSLGLKGQTVQNPALLISNQAKFQSYKPAFMLNNEEEERNSRL